MTAICVVQARMGSSRLPGKVLMDLAGRPVLGLQLARLWRGQLHVVVATSDLPQDDPVATYAAGLGAEVVRGSEADVLARFGLVAAAHPEAETFVRLTADCPFTDPGIVRKVLGVHAATRADYTSNTLVRTYPDGFDVEVLSRAALAAAVDEADQPEEREHVTPFLVRRPERFVLAAACSGQLMGDRRLTLDTSDDFVVLAAAAGAVSDPVASEWWTFPTTSQQPSSPLVVVPRCVEGRLEQRSFAAVEDGREVGEANVTVRSGTATIALTAPLHHRAELERGVRRWLAMDLQSQRIVVQPDS